MSARGPYRCSPEIKNPALAGFRSGKPKRREAQETCTLSANLIQMWLTQFDRGELDPENVAASTWPNTKPGSRLNRLHFARRK
jgi:transposase